MLCYAQSVRINQVKSLKESRLTIRWDGDQDPVASEDRARHKVPTIKGPSTRPIVISMIAGSYLQRRRRLTIFEPDEMKW